jgi:RNase H-fold protein (predicted Holliday junction resolvase)
MSGRILCVDPGEKRIGLALSDPGGMIATPLKVIPHVSRAADAALIALIAVEEHAERIIVGQPLDAEGLPKYARSAPFRPCRRINSNPNESAGGTLG